MKFRRRRSSRIPRPDWRAEKAPPVIGSDWSRKEPGREVDRGRRSLRVLAGIAALLELGLLVWLLAGPAFDVRRVDVTGAHRLDHAQVVAVAGLERPGSVFAVDAATIRRRLSGATWVRSAAVSAQLPDRIVVQVDEWQPVADYHAGKGKPYFVSDQGVALGPSPPSDGLLDIQGPTGPDPKPGRQAMDARLLAALVNLQRGMPILLPGQEVQSFSVDSCGNLTMTARKGWQAQFGRVLTPEEYSSLDAKLGALRSVSTKIDYNNPDLEYVNVMNPSAAAVKLKSAKPAPTPTPSPLPKGAPPAPSPSIQMVAPCR